jgi:hypothetical protein
MIVLLSALGRLRGQDNCIPPIVKGLLTAVLAPGLPGMPVAPQTQPPDARLRISAAVVRWGAELRQGVGK